MLDFWRKASIRGWKRWPEHQTRWDLNIVLTHAENLNTWGQYKVSVAHQKAVQNSWVYLRFRVNGELASVIHDLQTITGQSFEVDWLQAPVIAIEDQHASSQRCIHVVIIARGKRGPQAYPSWVLASIRTDQILMQFVRLADLHKTEFLSNPQHCEFFCKQTAKFNRHNSETEVQFDRRLPQVTEVHAQKTQCNHMLNQLR